MYQCFFVFLICHERRECVNVFDSMQIRIQMNISISIKLSCPTESKKYNNNKTAETMICDHPNAETCFPSIYSSIEIRIDIHAYNI